MTFEYQKYVLPMRRRFQAAGKTVFNKSRKRQPRPELFGLSRRAYLTRYMRLWRAGLL